MNKFIKVINNPYFIFVYFARRGYFNWMSDEKYLKYFFRGMMGQKLNLDNPKSFSEKLQWLKVYDRNPLYTKLVDKYEAKKIIAQQIGEEYIIPTLGVWDRFEDIDFNLLPNQFVLKCTHDSGGLVVCKDKATLDFDQAKKKIQESYKNNYYFYGREWPYKDVKPRIIAEKYMEDTSTGELRDYKFFCFNGEVKALFVATDRIGSKETNFDFIDADYQHLPFTNGHLNASTIPAKPINFEKMKAIASKLSQNIPHVRVDLYECNGKVYFGEMTFTHWSGFMQYEPQEWDYTFGSWLKLPEKHQ